MWPYMRFTEAGAWYTDVVQRSSIADFAGHCLSTTSFQVMRPGLRVLTGDADNGQGASSHPGLELF